MSFFFFVNCSKFIYYRTWQENAQYATLEENTIRLFSELTVCHTANQKLFASTLHSILESMHYTGKNKFDDRQIIIKLAVPLSLVNLTKIRTKMLYSFLQLIDYQIQKEFFNLN